MTKRVENPYANGRGRSAEAEANFTAIVDDLAEHDGSPLPAIAKRTNLSENTVSKHLHVAETMNVARHEGGRRHRRWYLR